VHYYLGAYVLDGDTFWPRGRGQVGWSAIDLRPDPAVLAGRCFVAVPVRDETIGEYLGQDPDGSIPAPVLRRIGTALSLTLAETRVRPLLAELLMVHGRTDGSRWKPLRQTRQGVYEIWLGGLLFRSPVLAGGSSLAESWNVADSGGLTGDLTWTEYLGADWAIVSQVARLAGNTGKDEGRADSDLASDDHYCQATLVTYTRVGGDCRVGVTCRKDSTATETYYVFHADHSGTPQHLLVKVAGSTRTVLQTAVDDPATGTVIKVQADGSTISGWIDGVQKVSATDTGIVNNTRCGIMGLLSNAGNVAELDNWSAADLAAAATIPIFMQSYRQRRVMV